METIAIVEHSMNLFVEVTTQHIRMTVREDVQVLEGNTTVVAEVLLGEYCQIFSEILLTIEITEFLSLSILS